MIFHAGTKSENGEIVTNGGRVLCVSALSENLSAALEKSYQGVEKLTFDKANYRRDIGKDLLAYS